LIALGVLGRFDRGFGELGEFQIVFEVDVDCDDVELARFGQLLDELRAVKAQVRPMNRERITGGGTILRIHGIQGFELRDLIFEGLRFGHRNKGFVRRSFAFLDVFADDAQHFRRILRLRAR
jgi:hypothetical protein